MPGDLFPERAADGLTTAEAVRAETSFRSMPPATPPARVSCPAGRLADLADLVVDVPKDVAYPDADSPVCCRSSARGSKVASVPTATSSPSRSSVRTRASR